MSSIYEQLLEEERRRQQATSGSGGDTATGGSGLATPVANPGTNGSNMRYYLGNLQKLPDGTYTDGTYRYDSNGLSLDRPDSPVAGLPPANQSESYDVWRLSSDGGDGTGAGDSNLTGSPYYQQVLAATNSAAAADAAARRSALQQALIGFGLVPEGFQDKYGDVDALTRQLADKNTSSGISTRARLLQARSDAIKQFTRGLSARGMRRSGAKGFGLRRRQLAFDQSYSDALSKLLGYTGGLYSQFAQNEYQRQLALANALANASQNTSNFTSNTSNTSGSHFNDLPYNPGSTAPDWFAPLANTSSPSSSSPGGKWGIE